MEYPASPPVRSGGPKMQPLALNHETRICFFLNFIRNGCCDGADLVICGCADASVAPATGRISAIGTACINFVFLAASLHLIAWMKSPQNLPRQARPANLPGAAKRRRIAPAAAPAEPVRTAAASRNFASACTRRASPGRPPTPEPLAPAPPPGWRQDVGGQIAAPVRR